MRRVEFSTTGGNIVIYEYKAEDLDGVDMGTPAEANRTATTAQRYIKRIHYGNAAPNVADDWLFEVVFDDDAPPDNTAENAYSADVRARRSPVRRSVRRPHEPADEGPLAIASEPIEQELIRLEANRVELCDQAHVYPSDRALQYQCFGSDGGFSYEHRDTLSPEGAPTLDAAEHHPRGDRDAAKPSADISCTRGSPITDDLCLRTIFRSHVRA